MRAFTNICMVLLFSISGIGIALSLAYQVDPETFYKVKMDILNMLDLVDEETTDITPLHRKPTALDIIPTK